MKLYTFEANGQRRIGAEWERQLIDLPASYNALLASQGPKPGALRVIPSEMLSFARLGALALEAARDTIRFVQRRPAVPVGEQLVYPFEEVRILAPIPRPGKILCASNFQGGAPGPAPSGVPAEPFFFSKLPCAVIGPGEAIVMPKAISALDCAAGLVAVIGRRIKAIAEDEVMNSVLGFTLMNDLSAREVIQRSHQITLGKNFDTFCPLGPCIVTPDEFSDPSVARLLTALNGKLRQEDRAEGWRFSVPAIISFLSRVMTLDPGDLVSTGAFSGLEAPPNASGTIQPADVVAIEAEGIGRLENPVIAEE